MRHIQFLLPVLISVSFTSCAEYNYDDRQEIKSTLTPPPSIYSNGAKRTLVIDKRMERVRSQGCVDNSTDCGRPVGW